MKFNSNRLWYIFFRTWEVGKRNIELKYFFISKEKTSLCYGNQEGENEFYWT